MLLSIKGIPVPTFCQSNFATLVLDGATVKINSHNSHNNKLIYLYNLILIVIENAVLLYFLLPVTIPTLPQINYLGKKIYI